MTELERLAGIRFIGVQVFGQVRLALFDDCCWHTTFVVNPGETIGEALDRVKVRFGEQVNG